MKCPSCGKTDIRQVVDARWQVVNDSFMCKDCNLYGNKALFCEYSDKEDTK